MIFTPPRSLTCLHSCGIAAKSKNNFILSSKNICKCDRRLIETCRGGNKLNLLLRGLLFDLCKLEGMLAS